MYSWYQILFSGVSFCALGIAAVAGVIWLVQKIRKKRSKAGTAAIVFLCIAVAFFLAFGLSSGKTERPEKVRATTEVPVTTEAPVTTEVRVTTEAPVTTETAARETNKSADTMESEAAVTAQKNETDGISMDWYSASAESIERLAVELFDFEYSDLQVTWDELNHAFSVSYLPEHVLDETTYVNRNINRYIHFCRYAYQIEGLERLRFDVMLAGMDQYGNDMVIEGMSMLMERETFMKFNWENLEYMDIWESFANNCAYIGIDPVIGRELDESGIFYDPYMRDGKIQ